MSKSLGRLFNIGCGDNSCCWGSRGGMATNGGCRCYKDIRPTTIEGRVELMQLRGGISLLRELAELPQLEAALVELIKRIRIQATLNANDMP